MSMTKGTPASSQIVWLEGRVQELEADNERLRAALREIATYEIEEGCPCNACQHSALARAALEEKP